MRNLLIIFLCFCSYLLTAQESAKSIPELQPNQRIPTTSTTITLISIKATDSKQAPDFEQALLALQEEQGFALYSLSIASSAELVLWQKHLRENQSACQSKLLSAGSEALEFCLHSDYPACVILDQDGILQYIGRTNVRTVRRRLNKMLKS